MDDPRTVQTLKDTIKALDRLIESPHTSDTRRASAQTTRAELKSIIDRIALPERAGAGVGGDVEKG